MKKLVLLPGSTRTGSFNHALLKCIPASQGQIDLVKPEELRSPVFDQEMLDSVGIPSNLRTIGDRIARADAVIVSSPEYNGSISSPLKNLLDWTSKMDPMPWEDRPVLLMGASPGALGAIRGLWHTRVPFEALGAWVYPEMFGLPRAHEAFGADGQLQDPKTRSRLQALLEDFGKFASR
jgi:chromate reductase